MRNSEWGDGNALCCCEYYNIEEERSHILGCCCNCQDLDESFDNFLTGQRVPQHRKSAVMATLQDRIRIPWRGGAKQISPDSLVPVILVPLIFLLSAFDLILTLVFCILIPIFLHHAVSWFRSHHPRTKFFVIWGFMSFLVIALLFEFKVIALLEILPEENLALGILTALFAFCAFRVKVTAGRWQQLSYVQLPDEESCQEQNGGEDFCVTCRKKIGERMYHCTICQTCVPERDFHFIWYDCCIGSSNNGMFLLSLVLAIAALLYSSNLTLTTICHPFIVFETVLLPDDCSDVFEEYDMALCFTSAVYSILIALYLLWILIRQIITISRGLTGQEWRQLSFSNRLCCGFRTIHPYNKGFIINWLRIFCMNEKVKSYETDKQIPDTITLETHQN